jgi:hypothetical protein
MLNLALFNVDLSVVKLNAVILSVAAPIANLKMTKVARVACL